MVAMALGVIHGALLSAAAWTLRMQPGIEISRSSNDDVNYLAIDGAADRLDFAETYLVA